MESNEKVTIKVVADPEVPIEEIRMVAHPSVIEFVEGLEPMFYLVMAYVVECMTSGVSPEDAVMMWNDKMNALFGEIDVKRK